jgi:hypothetical protein
MVLLKAACVLSVALTLSACTALEQLRAFVQPPRFEEAEGHRAEIRLLGPSADRPLGGAGIRLWAHVTNPNAFGFTLATLRGTLFLEDTRAATADLPLGLPLAARGETTFPIDLTISFNDVSNLANTIRRAVGRQPLAYHLDGTVGVDTGRYGTPTFGPMTLLRGDINGTALPAEVAFSVHRSGTLAGGERRMAQAYAPEFSPPCGYVDPPASSTSEPSSERRISKRCPAVHWSSSTAPTGFSPFCSSASSSRRLQSATRQENNARSPTTSGVNRPSSRCFQALRQRRQT